MHCFFVLLVWSELVLCGDGDWWLDVREKKKVDVVFGDDGGKELAC